VSGITRRSRAILLSLCSPLAEQVAAGLPDARPGYLDHHLSASLQRLVDLFSQVPVEELQRPCLVPIHDDAAQIQQFLVGQ